MTYNLDHSKYTGFQYVSIRKRKTPTRIGLPILEAILGARLPGKETTCFADGAVQSLQNGEEIEEELRMVEQDGEEILGDGSGEEVVPPPIPAGVGNTQPQDSSLEIMTQVGWMNDICEVDEKKKTEEEHERAQPKHRIRSKSTPLEAPTVPKSALEARVVGGDGIQTVNPAGQLQLIEPKFWI